VKDSDSMVSMVVNTKPGTAVPIVVYRDKQRKALNVTIEELDLEAEQSLSARRRTPNAPDPQPTPTGFGMTLDEITPELARRLDLPARSGGAIVADVERNSPAARAGVQPGDVILAVNRQKVANASQVTRELQKVQNGQVATMLVWRDDNTQFVVMTKR
jgi:serine protease Do